MGSGVMRTVSVVFDVVALNTVLPQPLAFGLLSQWVSFLVTATAIVFLSVPHTVDGHRRALGYSLDPDFGRIGLLPRRPLAYMALAGLFAGVSTFFYYILVGSTDASAVLPYGQLVLVYLLLGDLVSEKDTPTIVEVQCVLSVMIGVMLVGVSPGGFDVMTLLVVLGPMNVASALVTYFQRQTKRMEVGPGLHVDSLNMRLWSLLFLDLTFTALVLPLLGPSDYELMVTNFVPLLWLMVGSSLTIFLSLVFYVRALGRGSMAVVNSLASVSVVLGLPLTVVGDLFLPGAFGELPSDPFTWSLRLFGVLLVMIGVVALEAADVRSIVLISVRTGTGDILPALFDIKGVEKASAVAGTFDYLLCIKSRSLGKTRTNILKRVQEIEGVIEVRTLVVLRDYR